MLHREKIEASISYGQLLCETLYSYWKTIRRWSMHADAGFMQYLQTLKSLDLVEELLWILKDNLSPPRNTCSYCNQPSYLPLFWWTFLHLASHPWGTLNVSPFHGDHGGKKKLESLHSFDFTMWSRWLLSCGTSKNQHVFLVGVPYCFFRPRLMHLPQKMCQHQESKKRQPSPSHIITFSGISSFKPPHQGDVAYRWHVVNQISNKNATDFPEFFGWDVHKGVLPPGAWVI